MRGCKYPTLFCSVEVIRLGGLKDCGDGHLWCVMGEGPKGFWGKVVSLGVSRDAGCAPYYLEV